MPPMMVVSEFQVGMAEHPPAVDLAQNVFDGHTGTNHVGRVVHRKKDAGHDLNLQTDARIPKVRKGDSGLDSRIGGDDRQKERVVSNG